MLGFDGADFDFIDKWEDAMPNFKKLKKEGAWGKLKSTIPPVTSPAWPVLYTGKNPGKLGVFGFTQQKNSGYGDQLVGSESIGSQTLWEIASRKGKKCYVVNFPLTYPPKKIKGAMVSGMLTPSETSEYTYPKKFKQELKKACPEYKVHTPKMLDLEKGTYMDKLEKIVKARVCLLKQIIKNKGFDLLMLRFSIPDNPSHMFLKDVDENPERLENLKKVYVMADKALGEVMNEAKDCVFLVVSDHGSASWKQGKKVKHFYVNEWLRREGLLELKAWRRIFKSINKMSVYNFFFRLGIDLRKYLQKSKKIKTAVKGRSGAINFNKTCAFVSMLAFRHCGIRVNLKGRDPQGTVEEKELEKLKQKITGKLEGLVDPETNEKIVSKVWKREELYSGEKVDSAPDVIFELNMNYTPRGYVSKNLFDEKKNYTGIHAQYGIFFAYGPGIKKSEKLDGLDLLGIAPTTLHLLDLPIPGDMDGKVIDNIFEENSEFSKRTVKKTRAGADKKTGSVVRSKQEEEQVKKRLQELGYL
jgi:predicted AlkP superfamily phosphohydrolase/phosphomutase